MMLYSPTLHGMKNAEPSSAIGSVNALDYRTVILDGASNEPRKIPMFESRQTQWIIFDTTANSDSSTVTLVSITVPRIQLVWGYNWAFKGGFASCYSGNNANPGANFGVYRNGVNVFTNSPGVSSLNALIVSGTALIGRSNYVAAHASHALWLAGDRIEVFCTAAANAWRGGKVYIEGARQGAVI